MPKPIFIDDYAQTFSTNAEICKSLVMLAHKQRDTLSKTGADVYFSKNVGATAIIYNKDDSPFQIIGLKVVNSMGKFFHSEPLSFANVIIEAIAYEIEPFNNIPDEEIDTLKLTEQIQKIRNPLDTNPTGTFQKTLEINDINKCQAFKAALNQTNIYMFTERHPCDYSKNQQDQQAPPPPTFGCLLYLEALEKLLNTAIVVYYAVPQGTNKDQGKNILRLKWLIFETQEKLARFKKILQKQEEEKHPSEHLEKTRENIQKTTQDILVLKNQLQANQGRFVTSTTSSSESSTTSGSMPSPSAILSNYPSANASSSQSSSSRSMLPPAPPSVSTSASIGTAKRARSSSSSCPPSSTISSFPYSSANVNLISSFMPTPAPQQQPKSMLLSPTTPIGIQQKTIVPIKDTLEAETIKLTQLQGEAILDPKTQISNNIAQQVRQEELIEEIKRQMQKGNTTFIQIGKTQQPIRSTTLSFHNNISKQNFVVQSQQQTQSSTFLTSSNNSTSPVFPKTPDGFNFMQQAFNNQRLGYNTSTQPIESNLICSSLNDLHMDKEHCEALGKVLHTNFNVTAEAIAHDENTNPQYYYLSITGAKGNIDLAKAFVYSPPNSQISYSGSPSHH